MCETRYETSIPPKSEVTFIAKCGQRFTLDLGYTWPKEKRRASIAAALGTLAESIGCSRDEWTMEFSVTTYDDSGKTVKSWTVLSV